jgi:hypothetical protein
MERFVFESIGLTDSTFATLVPLGTQKMRPLNLHGSVVKDAKGLAHICSVDAMIAAKRRQPGVFLYGMV